MRAKKVRNREITGFYRDEKGVTHPITKKDAKKIVISTSNVPKAVIPRGHQILWNPETGKQVEVYKTFEEWRPSPHRSPTAWRTPRRFYFWTWASVNGISRGEEQGKFTSALYAIRDACIALGCELPKNYSGYAYRWERRGSFADKHTSIPPSGWERMKNRTEPTKSAETVEKTGIQWNSLKWKRFTPKKGTPIFLARSGGFYTHIPRTLEYFQKSYEEDKVFEVSDVNMLVSRRILHTGDCVVDENGNILIMTDDGWDKLPFKLPEKGE